MDYSLITPERAAKLELLIHLLTNSNRTIVLCGSKGVGKTTLLNAFRQRTNETDLTVLIQGKEALTLEQIETQVLIHHPKNQTLAELFDVYNAQQQKIVLLIDDAGLLPPYLITQLIELAAQHTVLKLVFVLTHDELAVKTYSDSAIEDAHIIEMPPLTQAQCVDFLQHLALKTTLPVPKQVSDDMIAELYQQTHGIPAKILTQLPTLAKRKTHKPQDPINVGLILMLLLLMLGILLFTLPKAVLEPILPYLDKLHP